MALRRITPIPAFSQYVKPKDLGPEPVLEWVAPTDLYVDDVYQRDLTVRSSQLLRRMVTGFQWRKSKPPIVVMSDGLMHVIDGQHTALAAASIGLPKIPVYIVGADALKDRAQSFVAHNRDRVHVSPFAVYKAMVAAGDEEAVLMAATLERAGVRLKSLNQQSVLEPGDTSAITTIQNMMKQHGPMRSRVVLECLRKADRIPISGDEIKAAAAMLWVRQPRCTPEALVEAASAMGDMGLRQIAAQAKGVHMPVWRALVSRWSKVTDGKTAKQGATVAA